MSAQVMCCWEGQRDDSEDDIDRVFSTLPARQLRQNAALLWCSKVIHMERVGKSFQAPSSRNRSTWIPRRQNHRCSRPSLHRSSKQLRMLFLTVTTTYSYRSYVIRGSEDCERASLWHISRSMSTVELAWRRCAVGRYNGRSSYSSIASKTAESVRPLTDHVRTIESRATMGDVQGTSNRRYPSTSAWTKSWHDRGLHSRHVQPSVDNSGGQITGNGWQRSQVAGTYLSATKSWRSTEQINASRNKLRQKWTQSVRAGKRTNTGGGPKSCLQRHIGPNWKESWWIAVSRCPRWNRKDVRHQLTPG